MNLRCNSEVTAEIGQYFIDQSLCPCYLTPFTVIFLQQKKTHRYHEIINIWEK